MPPDNFVDNQDEWPSTPAGPTGPDGIPGDPGAPSPGHEGVPNTEDRDAAEFKAGGGHCFADAPEPKPAAGLRPVGSEGPLQALPGVNFETGEGIAPEEPAQVPLAPGENVMSNRRFPNGALFNYAPAACTDNPDMQIIFDANRLLVGFVKNESVAVFICGACTEHANRINEQFMKQQAADASPLVNKAGRPLKS